MYVEVLRLLLKNEEEQFVKIFNFIGVFLEVCPKLEKEAIYYLFLHHPRVDTAAFNKVQYFWNYHSDQIDKLVIDQWVYNEFDKIMFEFSNSIFSTLPDSLQIQARFNNAFFSVFVPRWQPLTDYFRITYLSEEGETWAEDAWKTHKGLRKPFIKGGNVGVYLNWEIAHNQPTLFISFSDFNSNRAFSTYIPIEISFLELTEERKKKFFLFLLNLSQVILGEDKILNPPIAGHAFYSIVPCFELLENVLTQYIEDFSINEINALWTFMNRIKSSYRRLHYESVGLIGHIDPILNEPEKIAASGDIFPTRNGNALLPEVLLKKQKDPVCFTSEITEEFGDQCREMFSQYTERFQLFPYTIKTTKSRYRIGYRAETAEQMIGPPHHKTTHRNEVAPPPEQIKGMYVTFRVGDIHRTLRYPPEALRENGTKLFLDHLVLHILYLKSALYYHSLLKFEKSLPFSPRKKT